MSVRSQRRSLLRQAPPRTRLGSPVISVTHSRAYLRQRIAAAQECRARQDRKWRRRVWVAGACIAFYVVIGHDLIGMTQALGRAACTGVRKDIHAVAVAVKKAVEAKQQERDLHSPYPFDLEPAPASDSSGGAGASDAAGGAAGKR